MLFRPREEKLNSLTNANDERDGLKKKLRSEIEGLQGDLTVSREENERLREELARVQGELDQSNRRSEAGESSGNQDMLRQIAFLQKMITDKEEEVL